MTAAFVLKKVVQLSGLLVSALLVICVLRAVLLFPTPKAAQQCASTPNHRRIDESSRPGVIERFSQALRFQTVTRGTKQYNLDQLLQLTAFLQECACVHPHHSVSLSRASAVSGGSSSSLSACLSVLMEERICHSTGEPVRLVAHDTRACRVRRREVPLPVSQSPAPAA